MGSPAQIDYQKLAQQAGATGFTPAQSQQPSATPQQPSQPQQPQVDYAALAKQAGATGFTPADHSSQPAIGPASLSVWDRLKRVFSTGIPALNPDFEAQSHFDQATLPSGSTPTMQLVTPQAAMTSIEQTKNPISTGIAEFTGGLTSPESVALLAASGGLGELPGAAGKIVPRLASAGFSGLQIQSAFKEIPAFRAALADGNAGEAERILTHMTLGLAAAAMGAQHATTGEVPAEAFPGMNRAIDDLTQRAVSKARSVGANVADKVSNLTDAATGTAARIAAPVVQGFDTATNAFDRFESPEKLSEHAQKNIVNAARPGQFAFRGYPGAVEQVQPYLQAIHAENPEAFSSPQDLSEGIKSYRESIDAKLRDFAESNRDNPDAQLDGIRDQIKAGLEKFFDKTRGQYDKSEIQPAIDSVISRLDQDGRDPNLFEVENIRKGFNQQTAAQYGPNAKNVPQAEIAAKTEAASLLRIAIDEKYSDLGVDNVREWRTAEKSLIKLEDQLALGEKGSWTMNKPNLIGSVIREKGPVRGALGYINDVLNNPNALTQSAGTKLGKLPQGQAIVPTFNSGNQP